MREAKSGGYALPYASGGVVKTDGVWDTGPGYTRQTNKHTNTQTNQPTNKHINKHTNTQTHTQTTKQTNNKQHKHTHNKQHTSIVTGKQIGRAHV